MELHSSTKSALPPGDVFDDSIRTHTPTSIDMLQPQVACAVRGFISPRDGPSTRWCRPHITAYKDFSGLSDMTRQHVN